jgi:hypothetical protein
MIATASGRLLTATMCRLLVPTASRSVFQHSSPTIGLGLLAAIDVVDNSTWRTYIIAL